MQLQAGTILRDYKIEKLLGKGGMGTVYLAKDSSLDRYVAIKELNPVLSADADLIARFHNEAKLQAKLIHTNIAVLYNFFEQDGRYFMVMEYAEGMTLKEIIGQTGPIPEVRAINIIKQVVSALEYAHGMGIVHRDIKPSNIILDDTDKVKILDFGIARVMGERGLTQTGQQIGTVAYMSPEQVQAKKDIDGKTDIYSLGVTLYEMLSGRMPYDLDSQSDYEVMDSIVKIPLPDPRKNYPYISDNTVEILARMTEKDRHKRLDITTLKSYPVDNINIGKFEKKKSRNILWLTVLIPILLGVGILSYAIIVHKKAEFLEVVPDNGLLSKNIDEREMDEKIEIELGNDVSRAFDDETGEESVDQEAYERARQLVSIPNNTRSDDAHDDTSVNFEPYDDEPMPMTSITPIYPDFALKNKIQGTVILEVEILKDGTVRDIHVRRSVPGGLDQAAIDAVRKVKFQPGRSGGKPIDVLLIVPVEFKLN